MDLNFFREKTSDFWEMNLHHVITICLVINMIFMNSISIGCFILFTHSIVDVVLSTCKILSHTIYKTASAVGFSITIIVWILTRNVMIPIMTIAGWRGWINPPEL